MVMPLFLPAKCQIKCPARLIIFINPTCFNSFRFFFNSRYFAFSAVLSSLLLQRNYQSNKFPKKLNSTVMKIKQVLSTMVLPFFGSSSTCPK